MFYRSQYSFEINQNITVLNDLLKNKLIGSFDVEIDNLFKIKTPYFGEFSYDEFILTTRAKPFDRIGIEPDAHLKLQKLNDLSTRINVDIKLSVLWQLILVFLNSIAISVGLFASRITVFNQNIEENWLNRTLLIVMTLSIINLYVWISFRIQTNQFKKFINPHFFS
jgi:hypothetical protein